METMTYEELYGKRDGAVATLMDHYEWLCEKYNGKRKFVFNRRLGPARSRWYKIFSRIADMQSTIIPDPKIYLEAQFERGQEEPTPPYHLVGDMAIERYAKRVDELYFHENSKVLVSKIAKFDDSIAIVSHAVQTKKVLERLSLEIFGRPGLPVQELACSQKFWMAVSNGSVSPYYLSVSRSYAGIDKASAGEYSAFLPTDLDIYRDELLGTPGAIGKFMEIFGDDIDDREQPERGGDNG